MFTAICFEVLPEVDGQSSCSFTARVRKTIIQGKAGRGSGGGGGGGGGIDSYKGIIIVNKARLQSNTRCTKVSVGPRKHVDKVVAPPGLK